MKHLKVLTKKLINNSEIKTLDKLYAYEVTNSCPYQYDYAICYGAGSYDKCTIDDHAACTYGSTDICGYDYDSTADGGGYCTGGYIDDICERVDARSCVEG